jgi:uncharacterized membrane protein
MDWTAILRWLHVIGATVLLGTGAGIAFFMVMAQRTGRAEIVAHVARTVVVADFLFTSLAVIAQPVSGLVLARLLGWPLTDGWLLLSIALYGVTGLCWLPVVWIQVRIQRLAQAAADAGEPLPAEEARLFKIWMLLGIPAFVAVLTIIWLMLARPAIG